MDKIKLLIVDDEPMSIEYFKSFMKDQKRYEIIGEAYDGKSGYEMIKRVKPDIIFADISMPVMDGLTLAKKLLSESGQWKIILLTSYRDFEYVREGLKIGVSSYLLKHQITEALLSEEIEKTMEKIQAQRETEKKLFSYNLRNFLRSKADSETKFAECFYGKDYEFLIIYMVVDKLLYPERKEQVSDQSRLEEMGQYEADGFRCRGIVQLEPESFTAVCSVPSGMGQKQNRQLALEFANKMQRLFAGEQRTASVLISKGAGNFYQLPAVSKELSVYGRRLYLLKRNVIVFQEEWGLSWEEANVNIPADFLTALEFGEEQTLIWLTQLFDGAAAYDFDEFKRVLEDIVNTIEFYGSRQKIELSFSEREEKCYTVLEAEILMKQYAAEAFQAKTQLEQMGYSPMIKNALYYIHENYGSNISLLDIAEYSKASESYLRKRFKVETGSTMVDYLTSYRIENSKKLLESGSCRVSEVYQLSGFSSSQYFSNVFKKIEGISPSEYRNRFL